MDFRTGFLGRVRDRGSDHAKGGPDRWCRCRPVGGKDLRTGAQGLMGEAGEAEFDKFQNEYGYLATEIYEDMKQTSHLLDIADQTHAKWHESDLGVLLVLPYEHVMAFAHENLTNDFDNSPLHQYVFGTISTLIMNSYEAMEDGQVER